MFSQEDRRPSADAAIERGREVAEATPLAGTVLLEDDLEQVAGGESLSLNWW
jgi:hypothetical protein